MRFFLLLGDVRPPLPTLTETMPLPQPATIWIAGSALAVAVFLTLLGLLRQRKRLHAVLAASVAVIVVLALTALAARYAAEKWRDFEAPRRWTPPPEPQWEPDLPPSELGPAVAPPL